MSKSIHTKTAGVIVLIALAAALWVYIDHSAQEKLLSRADARIETGIAFFKDKNYPEALRVFENIPPGVPREWYARYYQGSTHIKLKNYQSAIPLLEQALALNPTDTQVMHALAVAYFKLGKLKISKAYYTSILEIDPEDTEARGLVEVLTNMEKRQPDSGLQQPEAETEREPDLQ